MAWAVAGSRVVPNSLRSAPRLKHRPAPRSTTRSIVSSSTASSSPSYSASRIVRSIALPCAALSSTSYKPLTLPRHLHRAGRGGSSRFARRQPSCVLIRCPATGHRRAILQPDRPPAASRAVGAAIAPPPLAARGWASTCRVTVSSRKGGSITTSTRSASGLAGPPMPITGQGGSRRSAGRSCPSARSSSASGCSQGGAPCQRSAILRRKAARFIEWRPADWRNTPRLCHTAARLSAAKARMVDEMLNLLSKKRDSLIFC